MKYQIYKAPGWHGQPTDPLVSETDDPHKAAMMAGERVDIHLPGNCNRYHQYAVGPDGEEVEPIDSYCCDICGQLFEWGEHGPQGGKDGRILDCPGGSEKHTVTWMCDDCADEYETD